jgi:hypothetical protein
MEGGGEKAPGKGELINGAPKYKAPKALKDKAPITIPSRIL